MPLHRRMRMMVMASRLRCCCRFDKQMTSAEHISCNGEISGAHWRWHFYGAISRYVFEVRTRYEKIKRALKRNYRLKRTADIDINDAISDIRMPRFRYIICCRSMQFPRSTATHGNDFLKKMIRMHRNVAVLNARSACSVEETAGIMMMA